jgi:hypothetical protein
VEISGVHTEVRQRMEGETEEFMWRYGVDLEGFYWVIGDYFFRRDENGVFFEDSTERFSSRKWR